MRFQKLAIVGLVVMAAVGCSERGTVSSGASVEDKILANTSHQFECKRVKDETDGATEVLLYLDGYLIGKGDEGYAELKRYIALMPRGTTVRFILPGPYRGSPVNYGIDLIDLMKWYQRYDINGLAIPTSR